ncbi:hypothetical protein [Deinococcus detaillensis]|uniref:hypothetical protein n=1 Tax=Deinococcus detaillensis TaxID=2592048 RepID=UPI00163D6B43|nr:hypothetical protein [Deinococcus detaillensis]
MTRLKTIKAKTNNRSAFGVGFFISTGAGVGVVAGTLLGDLVAGMMYGAGAGVIVGAVVEMYRRQLPPPAPPHTGQLLRPGSLRWLIGCLIFLGVSALFGGIILVSSPSGAGPSIPLSVLRYSPFSDFLMPGLILGTVFGVGSIGAVLALWMRPAWPLGTALTRFTGEHWAWSVAVALGLGQIIWIVTQILMLRELNVVQVLYGSLGVLIVVLACLPGVRQYFALRPDLLLSGRPR